MRPSFEETFRSEYPRLRRYLHRRVGAAAADDLAAATFTAAYQSWEKLDPARSVRPWLYGIASNLMRRHWRAERRMLRAWARTGVDPLAREEGDEAVARVDANATGRRLAAALAKRPKREREVLLLSVWADLSDREIADSLELPIGTVKSRLSRAKAQLRRDLDTDLERFSRAHRLTKEVS